MPTTGPKCSAAAFSMLYIPHKTVKATQTRDSWWVMVLITSVFTVRGSCSQLATAVTPYAAVHRQNPVVLAKARTNSYHIVFPPVRSAFQQRAGVLCSHRSVIECTRAEGGTRQQQTTTKGFEAIGSVHTHQRSWWHSRCQTFLLQQDSVRRWLPFVQLFLVF